MPIYYNKKVLTKTEDKTKGKNVSPENGFYINEDDEEFFIKKPKDLKELFTELFAGLLIAEFKKQGLIAPDYHNSLIGAGLIQFEDGSYGLIQPKILFTELCDVIGTRKKNSSGRDPLYEMFYGASCYPTLTKQGAYFGLSYAFMIALLMGNYSVHSDNVFLRETNLVTEREESVVQFGLIDWGASFRDYATEDNNKNILEPHEYNKNYYSWYTKGYINNYKRIGNFFPCVGGHARQFKGMLTSQSLLEIVQAALSKIPATMLDEKTKGDLAVYMGMPDFADATFGGVEEGYLKVATCFANVMKDRLNQLAELENQTELSAAELPPDVDVYQSFRANPTTVALSVDDDKALPDQLENWQTVLSNRYNEFDFTDLDIKTYEEKFNHYVELLAKQAEAFNLWEHDEASNQNVFVPYREANEPNIYMGNAFVPHYRESTVLHHLYTISSEGQGSARFNVYEKTTVNYCKAKEDSSWKKICTVLDNGFAVYSTLQMIKKAQGLKYDKDLYGEEGKAEHLQTLRSQLALFAKSHDELNKHIESIDKTMIKELHFESEFFYPLSDDELNNMNGEQLVTICLDELNSENPSSILARIINQESLWGKMSEAFSNNVEFHRRVDKPEEKFVLLNNYRSLVVEFQIAHDEFQRASKLEMKKALLNALEAKFNVLPVFIQDKYQNDVVDCTNESVFLSAVSELSKKDTLSDWQDTYQSLVIPAYLNLTDDTKKRNESRINDLIVFEQDYDWLLTKKFVPDSIQRINQVRDCWYANKHIDASVCIDSLDESMWKTIEEAATRETDPKVMLSKVEQDDLLILRGFRDQKIKENTTKDAEEYAAYENSINNFYSKALAVRLSNKPMKQQLTEIQSIASKEFQHRDYYKRIAVDVAIIVSILFAGLGGFIMLGRYLKGNEPLFSQEKTRREEDLTSNWLKNLSKSAELAESEGTSNLFVSPTVTVSA